MSYGGQCRNRFSDQQIARMHYALENKVPDLIEVAVYAKNIIAGSNVSGSTLTLANSIMSSGDSLNHLDGNQYEEKTNHERFNNYQGIGNFKHHTWNNVSTEFKLKENFVVNRTIENGRKRYANFVPLNSIDKVQNQLMELNNSNTYGFILNLKTHVIYFHLKINQITLFSFRHLMYQLALTIKPQVAFSLIKIQTPIILMFPTIP